MVTAKKSKSKLSAFFTTSPLKTAASILIVVSFLLNIGALLFIVLLNHTSAFDLTLENYTITKTCGTDYREVLNTVGMGSSDPAAAKKFFAAAVCFRDYQTGKPINIKTVQPLQ